MYFFFIKFHSVNNMNIIKIVFEFVRLWVGLSRVYLIIN